MRLERIEIRDLWSYSGPELTVAGQLGDVNVVIGRNNAGKSNLMRAIKWACENPAASFEEWGSYRPASENVFNPGVAKRETAPYLRLTFSLGDEDWSLPLPSSILRAVSERVPGCLGCKAELGFDCSMDGRGVFADVIPVNHEAFARSCEANRVERLEAEKALREACLSQVRKRLVPLDGWRRLTDPVEGASTFYEFLHNLQSSVSDIQGNYNCFEKIRQFFCKLTGLRDAKIYVRDGKCGFNVVVGDRALPLSSYGDGLSHLLMIAAKAAVHENCVIVIEEPETHLHPDLQRHLLRFLAKELSAQVILTTHSPVLLDSAYVDRVFFVDHSGQRSVLSVVDDPRSMYEVLEDIGARASDILQSNVVIWVEGPSDRVFLKRCLELYEKHNGDQVRLTEGLDFQIVCYGGALRSHLTFDEKVDSLINLMRLSRNVVMVCDSDRSSEEEPINSTKMRLKNECETTGGLYWVTAGREIENYINDVVLTRAYRKLLNKPKVNIRLGKFERLGQVIRKSVGRIPKGHAWKGAYDEHKVDIMKCLLEDIEPPAELARYDLMDRLKELRDFIAKANRHRITVLNV